MSPAAAQTGQPVRISGLTRRFGSRTVLENLDLQIEPGEFVALLGRSGSGKSTLLRTLAGLDPLTGDAQVTVPPVVATAFQEPRLLPWERVWRNVVIGMSGSGLKDLATGMLAEVGLGDRADAWPLALSGGEAQRVSLARALVREPQLLLLDEPFGALDALTRLTMHDLMRVLCDRHHPSVLLVTHDVDEAIALADRILVLADGRISGQHQVPRHPDAATAGQLKEELLGLLGVHAAAD